MPLRYWRSKPKKRGLKIQKPKKNLNLLLNKWSGKPVFSLHFILNDGIPNLLKMKDLQDTLILLQKDFEINIVKVVSTKEDLIDMLRPVIHQMLNRDFERLLQVCYRIDLGENKLKSILHESDPETMALDLAKALVERQMLKIELKRKYSEKA